MGRKLHWEQKNIIMNVEEWRGGGRSLNVKPSGSFLQSCRKLEQPLCDVKQ